jgi:hypothetical protein
MIRSGPGSGKADPGPGARSAGTSRPDPRPSPRRAHRTRAPRPGRSATSEWRGRCHCRSGRASAKNGRCCRPCRNPAVGAVLYEPGPGLFICDVSAGPTRRRFATRVTHPGARGLGRPSGRIWDLPASIPARECCGGIGVAGSRDGRAFRTQARSPLWHGALHPARQSPTNAPSRAATVSGRVPQNGSVA